LKNIESLSIKVGASAYKEIRNQGFDISKIRTILGASGGPKWLMLSHLDKLILEKFIPKIHGPVRLISSSIGAWRFICYAQKDPIKAINDFETGYIEQYFFNRTNKKIISAHLRNTLDLICSDSGIKDVIEHPTFRTNIITTRSHHILKSDFDPLLFFGLCSSMLANFFSRDALKYFFTRGLFVDAREPSFKLDQDSFFTHYIRLTEDNLKDAVIASSSIPLFLDGVRNINGAPNGVYRDGGIIDYHLDFPSVGSDDYALYPHFFDFLKPGWFDRSLPWRKLSLDNLERTILVCPSEEFIQGLPGSKIPDRSDFTKFSNEERIKIWKSVVNSCAKLADDLNEVLEKDQLPNIMKPF